MRGLQPTYSTDRFHFVLQSCTRDMLMSSGEQVRMQEGEALVVRRNKQYHQSHNEVDEWRIHYVFSLLSVDYCDLAVVPFCFRPNIRRSHRDCRAATRQLCAGEQSGRPQLRATSSCRAFASVRSCTAKISN